MPYFAHLRISLYPVRFGESSQARCGNTYGAENPLSNNATKIFQFVDEIIEREVSVALLWERALQLAVSADSPAIRCHLCGAG